MPKWEDEGIIIKIKKQGEKSFLLSVLTMKNGRYLGWLNSPSKKINLIQPGDIVHLRWNARLSQQLGNFNVEGLNTTVGMILENGIKLSILSSFCSLIEKMLPERELCLNFYKSCKKFLFELSDDSNEIFLLIEKYIKWEISILSEVGINLNLNNCILSGSYNNLMYVSPTSGNAVSEDYNGKYVDKLLLLPNCLGGKYLINEKNVFDLLGGLNLTHFFLKKFFKNLDYKNLNSLFFARNQLIENFKMKFI